MFELLFLCGLFAVMLGAIWEYVISLAAFPTVLAASAIIPLLAWSDYLRSLERLGLVGLGRHRAPVPPERFYWTLGRGRLRRMLAWTAALAVLSWAGALEFPADLRLNGSSMAGWIAGALAILATSRFCASAVIYLRASHWFDKMAPWAVGVCRRTMYHLSENPDFLGPPATRQEEEKKSVY